MERITDKIQELVQTFRGDLKQLEQHIAHFEGKSALTEEEHLLFKSMIQECHDSMRSKVHLLTTMLETDSAEILELVQQREHA